MLNLGFVIFVVVVSFVVIIIVVVFVIVVRVIVIMLVVSSLMGLIRLISRRTAGSGLSLFWVFRFVFIATRFFAAIIVLFII